MPPLRASVRKRAHKAEVSGVGQSPVSVLAVISSDSSQARISAGVTKTGSASSMAAIAARRDDRTVRISIAIMNYGTPFRPQSQHRHCIRRPAEGHAPSGTASSAQTSR